MSKKNIPNLFEEAKLKMNGHAVLFIYNLMNICINAEPMALLSATVIINDQEQNLEDVANICLANEKQFAITPKKAEYIFPICKAIKLEHPEFKMEERTEKNPITQEEQTTLYYTMPVINEDFYNASMDYINVRHEATSAKINLLFTTYTAQITQMMAGADLEKIEQAKDKLKELYDTYMEMINKSREQKEKEVEEAYQEYLKTATEQAKPAEEKEAAQGEETLFSMNMNDEE